MLIHYLSDLHGFRHEILKAENKDYVADLLILGGDMTARDTLEEWEEFYAWLQWLPYRHKVMIAGNHDNNLDPEKVKKAGCHYLQDSGVTIEDRLIWGTPWTKTFGGQNPHAKAFCVDSEAELYDKWKDMPDNIDILVSHSPMFGVIDENYLGTRCGSICLREIIEKKKTKGPEFLLCGHIHEQGLKKILFKNHDHNIICINGSYVDESYKSRGKYERIYIDED